MPKTTRSNNTTSPANGDIAAGCEATNRRRFMSTGAALTAGVAATSAARPIRGAEPAESVSHSPNSHIRLALIGAGGRGSGAINDSLTINENVSLAAIADLEGDKLRKICESLSKRHGDKVSVESGKMYGGIDAYKRILDDPEIDVVLFATPPGFRPQYVAEAVDAGKHVFAEKPTCVDPSGYRVCVKAHEQAVANKTSIVTGTQYRRQTNYVEAIKRLHDGAIGDIISATARYCSNGIWNKTRKEGMSDTEYQIYNWMHFIWLSGDQIAEQAVHNIDAINWIMGGPPESAYGSGGRFTRPEGSEMWDSMSIDYLYPGNRTVSFKCRQIPNAQSDNSNVIYGSNGICTIYGLNRGAEIRDKDGNEVWSMKGDIGAAYKQEHKDLVDSVRAGKPIVEFKETADSSLTAVLGRMAAYTGKLVTWDFAVNESTLSLFPENLDMSASLPEPAYAIPGKTKLV